LAIRMAVMERALTAVDGAPPDKSLFARRTNGGRA
jgi:hypothetical protein